MQSLIVRGEALVQGSLLLLRLLCCKVLLYSMDVGGSAM